MPLAMFFVGMSAWGRLDPLIGFLSNHRAHSADVRPSPNLSCQLRGIFPSDPFSGPRAPPRRPPPMQILRALCRVEPGLVPSNVGMGGRIRGPAFLIWSLLNTIAICYGSTAAFPFPTILLIFAMWACVTFPLTVLGGVVGRHRL